MDTNISHHESDRDEMGYVYLDDCEVVLNDSSKDCPDFSNKWMNVPLDNGSSSMSSPEPTTCLHCQLVLQYSKEIHNQLYMLRNGPRFDGMIQNVRPLCSCKKRRKSDSVLLLGLALTCQEIGHISIQSCRIRFSKTQDLSNLSNASKVLRGEMYITFAIPEMTTIRSNKHRPFKRQFVSNSAKLLPPSTQLLFSIMRSDWDYFETFTRHTNNRKRTINNQRRSPRSFFPSKLSLDEVYERINGAGCALVNDDVDLKKQDITIHTKIGLLDMPNDILQDHIAVYLKARSLDSLRQSCRDLHRILRSTVPGLKLKLYSHQIKSLSWMRYRETRCITEGDLVKENEGWRRRALDREGDAHRAASGGASVILCARNSPDEKAVRISQFNGEEIIVHPNNPLSRNVARGGLLCDDPGLGKTITVVSLILQTMGLSTEEEEGRSNDSIDESANKDDDDNDEKIFEAYWKEQVVQEFRCQYLNKIVNGFVKQYKDADYFMHPVDPILDHCPDYPDIVKDPICIKDIKRKIINPGYESFAAFESDMVKCFQNAKLYNPIGSTIHEAAKVLEVSFLESKVYPNNVIDFKEKMVAAAKKSFAKASAKPNSAVAALVERNSRAKLRNALLPSSGTLLVVPSVLLEHWQDQIQLHVDKDYISHRIPIIVVYTGTFHYEFQEDLVIKCKVKKTHFPFLFLDKTGSRQLPSADFLSMFSIVITSNQRFTNEWKNGSFEDQLNRNSSKYSFENDSDDACPLLKVNWLRMIVDEGHSMGRGRDNSAISFASWIMAERRWAMTGTPTRQTLTQSGLSNINNLMQYLQHSFFSRRQDGEAVWRNLITRGWNLGQLSSFFRVRTLLSLLMVRHTKADIEELPPPRYNTTILPMSADEVTTYNTLVCAVQSNLLITSMEGKTSGAQDSLLHRSQARHAKKALENVRLVCAGGTQVLPTLSQKNWSEFVRDFKVCNHSPDKLQEVVSYLSRASTGLLSRCQNCEMMLSTLLVFPCGHLVCTECVDSKTKSCIVCCESFDVDLFQRLQPGMDYQWLHNVEEETKNKTKKLNENEEHPVELLEDGEIVLAPLDPTRQRRRTRKPGDGHTCEYSPKLNNGECILCWKEHDGCNLVNAAKRCNVCYRRAENCPSSETKSAHVVDRLSKLHKSFQKYDKARFLSPFRMNTLRSKRPLKVIVFSQFRKVLNMTGDRLLRQFGSDCCAEYWGSFRKKELHKFIHNEDCFCMLLGKDGSEGLDLSFVTHIFFLEQVWDKSLEQQAVARAWRMGATGSVEVETLVAKNSVEETMSRLEKELGGNQSDYLSSNEGLKNSEYQRAKLQFLLKGLSLIANSHTLSFGGGKRKLTQTNTTKSAGEKKPRKASQVRFAE